jgi:hypothetical protein
MTTKVSGQVVNSALTTDAPAPHLVGATVPHNEMDKVELVLDTGERFFSVSKPIVRRNSMPGDLLDIFGAQNVKLTLNDDGLITEVDVYD